MHAPTALKVLAGLLAVGSTNARALTDRRAVDPSNPVDQTTQTTQIEERNAFLEGVTCGACIYKLGTGVENKLPLTYESVFHNGKVSEAAKITFTNVAGRELCKEISIPFTTDPATGENKKMCTANDKDTKANADEAAAMSKNPKAKGILESIEKKLGELTGAQALRLLKKAGIIL
ncbi:Uu.00g072390.m01.CDS01 [Anthostomella pinea]|uniref:Uu.00g072390.m01.CDS01 n=1 Tax=Anthostomella pinea TaxID=933095 RepID=A0AAI8YNQ8_9PEZI|nr:Uu.00g072390.m01.CDS01 [Anthostomella pinea]